MTNLKILTKELKEDKNLAYILGVLRGDGSIEWNKKNGDYIVRLNVNDKDFALTFKKILEAWSDFLVSFHVYEKGTTKYWVELSSKIIVTYLKKYNTINKIENLVKKVKGEKEFLRGMYDSEGCVSFYKYKNIQRTIVINNNDKQLLIFCKKLLKTLDIESGRLTIGDKKGTPYKIFNKVGFTNFDCYVFSINSKHNLIKFRDLVGFNIKRKQYKLIKALNSYIYKV